MGRALPSQYRLLSQRVRRADIRPRGGECSDHLRRGIDTWLLATESEAVEQAIEQARATVAATRQRYGSAV